MGAAPEGPLASCRVSGSTRVHLRPLAEVLGFFAAIMVYIWVLRTYASWTVFILFAFLICSHLRQGESIAAIGLGGQNAFRSARLLAPYLIVVLAGIILCGAIFGSFRNVSLGYGLTRLALYVGWGLFQQYMLNGYFARRIEAALPQSAPLTIAFITSVIFALAHLPNMPLMAFTFLAGLASVLVYLRYRNIYFLGFAHGTIGLVMIYSLPFSMRIGPGLLH